MASALSEKGYRIELVGRKLKRSLPLDDMGFQATRFRMLVRKGPFFYAFFNLRLFIFLLTRKQDLLISIDLDTLAANYLVSRMRKIPLLYDSHEYFTEVPELIGRPRVKRIWEQIEKKTLPNIRNAITVSESIAKTYQKKYQVSFQVVRNVAERRVPIHDQEFHTRYTANYKIIYQGALNVGRGLELMIHAMKHMSDTSFFIAGDGDIRQELIELVHELNLTDRVHFLGRLLPDLLYKVTCQCNMGISLEEDMGLSYRMSLPNKLFDYIQARIPVLCSDLPEMSKLVRTYGIGQVLETRSPEALAKKAIHLLQNKKLQKELKAKLEEASLSLCWENEKEKLIDIVRNLMDAEKARQL
jgi:glycosyltransferase involved in cell wall biosynthesis